MSVTQGPIRQERLSELVAHLCGAPLERSRSAVAEAVRRNDGDDSLWDVADALVSIKAEAA